MIASQPNVLVLANKDYRTFANWQGTRYNVQLDESEADMMPFVDRLKTVTSMTNAIVRNLKKAEVIQAGSYKEKNTLRLVGCGALFGAGKTTIGPVLHQCMQRALGDGKKVVYVLSVVDNDKSPYDMLIADFCSEPAMRELRTRINKDMIIEELIQETERYLAERNIVLFLHLDEFAPFNHAGRMANTQEQFYRCWRRMLMPILCSPSIGLYISGRMSYYDNIGASRSGQSPCLALSEQLELFDATIIDAALEKMSIPSDSTGDSTVSLAKALDELVSAVPGQQTLQQCGSWEIAQRLHNVTGGVPRFVQHALHALLVNRAVYSALFQRSGSEVICMALLDQLFGNGGAVYKAVTIAAEIHFSSIAAATASKEEREKRVMGLMQLVLLNGRVFQLSQMDVNRITRSIFSLDRGPIAQLISHAQYWGIHRNLHSDKKQISFALPPAVVDGLEPLLNDLMSVLPDLRDDTEVKDPTGGLSEKKVHDVLVFNRLLATLLRHSNWLGLQEDSDEPAKLLDLPADADGEPAILTSHIWDLLFLPKVISNGKLKGISELIQRLVYGKTYTSSDNQLENKHEDLEGDDDELDNEGESQKSGTKVKNKVKNKLNAKKNCPPELLGKYLSSLSSSEFHAFATEARSASADFLVRYGNDVTHLQVKNAEKFEFQHLLLECAKIAPTVSSSLDLQHTLVGIMMQPAARAASVQAIGSLSHESLVAKLEEALVNRDLNRAKKQQQRDADKMVVSSGKAASQAKKHAQEARRAAQRASRERLAVELVKTGKLKVVILDDAQHTRFFRYRELVKHLVSSKGG